jgi:hypothetical protein
VGPKVITDNLLVNLDAANIKSYPYHPGPSDHGISEWYCFISGTVTYAAMENVTIYEVTDLGAISVKVAASASPQRGQFATTAGYQYYGDGPIFLVAEDNHHFIAPLTMCGKQFGYYTANRETGVDSWIFYFYSPFGNANVNIYIDTVNGINSAPTDSIVVNKASTNTYTINDADGDKKIYFTSDEPILITTILESTIPSYWDRTILSPAQPIMYNRYLGFYSTLTNGAVSNSNYSNGISSAVYSNNGTDNVYSQTTADGAGGDTAQGLGLSYLCDSYCFGNTLSDYSISAPYDNTVIDVSYWNGSAWVILETHTLTGGTLQNPIATARDGTAGVGVEATNISGTANNFASGATLWKWTSNNPFYLGINDSVDDELSLLGWTSSRSTRTTNYADQNWKNLINQTNAALNNGVEYSDNIMYFDGVDDYVTVPNTNYPATWDDPFSMECWINIPASATWNTIYTSPIIIRGSYAGSHGIGRSTEENLLLSYIRGDSNIRTAYAPITRDAWYHIVATWNGSTTSIFSNGNLIQTSSSVTHTGVPESDTWRIGQAYAFGGSTGSAYQGYMASVRIYSKALSLSEVRFNFNASRKRFNV